MADDSSDGMLSQEEIDAAMAAAAKDRADPSADAGSSSGRAQDGGGKGEPAPEAGKSGDRGFEEVAEAMAEAADAEAAAGSVRESAGTSKAATPEPTEEQPFDIPELLQEAGERSRHQHGIDLLRDVELDVKIELGRSRMLVEDVLRLDEGSVVELDKLAGDPVDVLVNGRLVARGEVLVLNDTFCVRVNDIFSKDPDEDFEEG